MEIYDYLLQKYTSFVLSAGYGTKPDIPLFDHLKTTSAIAGCMYRWRKENMSSPDKHTEAYLLIEGDLSGIQNFIFDVVSSQEARVGMSKRLRGRSFWLTLMMDSVATKILDQLELQEINILWNTGGHFLILAPNLNKRVEELEGIKKEVNQNLLKDYNGKLFLALNWIGCCEEDLKNFSKTKEKLTQKTNRLKRQKFIGNQLTLGLDSRDDKNNSLKKIEDYCMICNSPLKLKSERETRKCNLCQKHEELGQKLAKAKYLIKELNPKHKPEDILSKFTIFNTTYSFDLNEINKENNTKIYTLNDTDFLDEKLIKQYPNASFGFKFLGKQMLIILVKYLLLV